MKIILLLAALALAWWWRSHREEEQAQRRSATPAPPPLLQDMVRCPVCAVHVPRSDAVVSPRGVFYCCAEHRRRAGN
ncbi:MAG: PP0621 family protein [Rhodoferax sp.]